MDYLNIHRDWRHKSVNIVRGITVHGGPFIWIHLNKIGMVGDINF
jgi:hypothetical protein